MNELERIKQHYQNHDDEKIKLIALNDAYGLKERTIPILIEEIRKRNLDTKLIDWVKAVSRKLSEQEFNNLKRKIRKSKCTKCLEENKELLGFEFTTRISALFIAHVKEHRFIVCKKCGRRNKRISMLLTTIFGWWSPIGFFMTPFILYDKIKDAIKEKSESERIIEEFINEYIGIITLNDESPQIIQTLINNINETPDNSTNYLIPLTDIDLLKSLE